MLVVNSISKVRSGKLVLNEINFKLQQGEVLGVLGPNGAGKTTLLKIICGLIKPDSGTFSINDLGKHSIATIFEDHYFLNHLSGHRNIEVFCAIFPTITRQQIEDAFIKYGIYESRNKKYGKYSTGMKRRMDLLSVFLPQKQLYILDEPTNSLDIDAIAAFNEEINFEKGKQKSFIISSHYAESLEKLCDRFIILIDGKIICNISKQEVLEKYNSLENAYHILKGIKYISTSND